MNNNINNNNTNEKEYDIQFTRTDTKGTAEQQIEAAKVITDFLEALPKYAGKEYQGRVVVAIKDFSDKIHIGWVVNNDYLFFKSCFKQIYILSYEVKIRETLEGKNARTLIYQEETDDGEDQFLYQNRICFLNRNFKNDPNMSNRSAIGYKTWLYCGKDMFDKFVEQSVVPSIFDDMSKQTFNDLLSGVIKELEDLSNLPSKEEGERILAEEARRKAEEERKKDLQELQEQLKDLPEYIEDLSSEQFKKAFNIVADRYHLYDFEDAVVETLGTQRIEMNLTGKMRFTWEPGVVKLYYKDNELEIGMASDSSLTDLKQAKTTDIKNLFNEIHSIFVSKFPKILKEEVFYEKVLKDFHKYYHGFSAW